MAWSSTSSWQRRPRLRIVASVSLMLMSLVCYHIISNRYQRRIQPFSPVKYNDSCVSGPEGDEKLAGSLEEWSQTPLFHPPLHTAGRHIVDSSGETVKLVSINWYGASDVEYVPGGLDVRHRHEIARLIRRMGFNSVRLPYSDEMVRRNPVIPDHAVHANPDLFGMRALDVFKASVDALTAAGLAVIVNNHITQARWCCDWDLCDVRWSNGLLGSHCSISQTETDWIDDWVTVMTPHVDNALVVGCDLRNEPRALFGSRGWETWAAAVELASARLLAMQPDWLMVVEGIASANDLSYAQSRPISLGVANKLVYSAHVYGWSGWGSLDPYWGRDYDSFAGDMYKNWAFLVDSDTAPVWISEFGAPDRPNVGDANYWRNLMRFMAERDVGFAYWALNPRKPATNSTESYSIIKDDWHTVLYDYRLCGLRKLMSNTTFSSPA